MEPPAAGNIEVALDIYVNHDEEMLVNLCDCKFPLVPSDRVTAGHTSYYF